MIDIPIQHLFIPRCLIVQHRWSPAKTFPRPQAPIVHSNNSCIQRSSEHSQHQREYRLTKRVLTQGEPDHIMPDEPLGSLQPASQFSENACDRGRNRAELLSRTPRRPAARTVVLRNVQIRHVCVSDRQHQRSSVSLNATLHRS